MSRESLIGKTVWLEMDKDRSAFAFSPRKGTIIHVFEQPSGEEAVVVNLLPPTFGFFLLPRRLALVVLRYGTTNDENIRRTFELGHSYAEVLRLTDRTAIQRDNVRDADVSRLGFASVFPWPKPSIEEVRSRIHARTRPVARGFLLFCGDPK